MTAGREIVRGGSGGKPPRVSLLRWLLWAFCLALGLTLFYVVLTPVWLGLRGAAWLAEFRSRRRRAPAEAREAA